MWLSIHILSWCRFSHSACQIVWEDMDESHEYRQRIGINGLAQYLRRGQCDALAPAYNLQTLLCTLHWSQLALEMRSFSQLQLFFHSHAHRHFQTYTQRFMHSQGALTGLWCLVELKKKMQWPFLFCLFVFSLIFTHEPYLSFCSLPLAAWRLSWGRVTCSLLAWQSASLSRPAA